MKLYHGSSSAISIDENSAMYFTANIQEAKEYALGLNDLGEYSDESYIYEIEIDDNQVVEEDDFGYFDCAAYTDYDNLPEILHNEESGYYILKHPSELRLIEFLKNQL